LNFLCSGGRLTLFAARFWALVGHVDQLARKQSLDVKDATDKLLVPVEEAPSNPPIVNAAQKLVAEESNAAATPKTRRKNAVEKGNLFLLFGPVVVDLCFLSAG
jgi:hypothetical protein